MHACADPENFCKGGTLTPALDQEGSDKVLPFQNLIPWEIEGGGPDPTPGWSGPHPRIPHVHLLDLLGPEVQVYRLHIQKRKK